MSEVAYLGLSEAGTALRAGKLSPVDLTQAALSQIERWDSSIRAWISVTAELALTQASTAAAELRGGRDRGPLHGVPIAVKDVFDIADIPTTAGSRALADAIPHRDASAVRRLRDAGAVILGKANTHEFAWGGTTPPTRNAWDLDRIPGGSSGGSAAALAAGMCMLAIGTDAAGSVRIPSAANGVTGLKPTYGRVPKNGALPLSWTMDHVGPLARSAADVAATLAFLAGRDPGDATSASEAVDDYVAGLERGVRGLRIGVPRSYFFEPAQPAVISAVYGAIETLRAEGAVVTDIEIEGTALAPVAGFLILLAEASDYHRHRLREHGDLLQPDVRARLEVGELVPATAYIRSQRFRRALRNEFLTALADVDLLVTPTLPCTAPPIGATSVDLGGFESGLSPALTRNTLPLNLAGLPAGTQPCGFDIDGLPVGLQIVGRPFDESTVLRAQHAFQRVTDWHERHPPALATSGS